MANQETVTAELNIVKSTAWTRSFVYKSARRSVRLIGADISASYTLKNGDAPIVVDGVSRIVVIDSQTKVKVTLKGTDTDLGSVFTTKFMVLTLTDDIYQIQVERTTDTDAATDVGFYLYWS